jgi:hypothetical protein
MPEVFHAMAGFVPAIHVFPDVTIQIEDARHKVHKVGHDG